MSPATLKRNVGVTHVAERPFSAQSIHPGALDGSKRDELSRPRDAPSALRPVREATRDVVLEDVDELGDEAVAPNVRSRRPSMNTRGDGFLERARQADPDVGCFDSPGPLTTQPMDRTRRSSAPDDVSRQTGICALE